MRTVQLAVGTTPALLFPNEYAPGRALPFSIAIIQNNSTATVRIGDTTVTITLGISLSPGASLTLTPALQYTGDMNEFYSVATAVCVLDLMLWD